MRRFCYDRSVTALGSGHESGDLTRESTTKIGICSDIWYCLQPNLRTRKYLILHCDCSVKNFTHDKLKEFLRLLDRKVRPLITVSELVATKKDSMLGPITVPVERNVPMVKITPTLPTRSSFR